MTLEWLWNDYQKMPVRWWAPGANDLIIFTAVIYHHSMVIPSFGVIKLCYPEIYRGMAVNYHGILTLEKVGLKGRNLPRYCFITLAPDDCEITVRWWCKMNLKSGASYVASLIRLTLSNIRLVRKCMTMYDTSFLVRYK